MACRPGGTVSLPGVFIDKVTVPTGAMVGKATHHIGLEQGPGPRQDLPRHEDGCLKVFIGP